MGREIRALNEYEILLMLDAEIAEERADEILARVRERVQADGGTWDVHEPWGRRRLAYEIGHKADGVYHLLLFTAAPATLAEISRVLKITDGVMRHLAVRRVKGGQTKAPPQPAPPPVAATAAAVAAAAAAPPPAAPAAPPAAAPAAPPAAPAAAAPAPSAPDDDADGTAE
jgi:small subunit ribosomal protein S6